MKEVKDALRKYLSINPVIGSVLPAGVILIFIFPAAELIYHISYYSSPLYFISNVLYGLCYACYLMGLLFCFALDKDLLIGIAFGIRALNQLIDMAMNFRYHAFSFSTFIYMLIYILLAVYFIRNFILYHYGYSGGYQPDAASYVSDNSSQPPKIRHCPGCGQPIEEDGAFCPNCGTPYGQSTGRFGGYSEGRSDTATRGFQQTVHSVSAYASDDPISLCGSVLMFILSIAYSLSLLLGLINGFSITGFLGSIPGILLCIGCWIVYAGAKQNNLTTTGFSLISGVLLFYYVVALIVPVVFVIISAIICFGIIGSEDGLVIFLIIAVVFVIVFAFYSLYYNGLRKPTKSIRSRIMGQQTDVNISMFVIVMMIIQAVSAVFGLFSLFSIQSSSYMIQQYISNIFYNLNMYDSSGISETLLEQIQKYFSNLASPLNIMASLSSVVTIIMAIIIAFKIRSIHNGQNMNHNS